MADFLKVAKADELLPGRHGGSEAAASGSPCSILTTTSTASRTAAPIKVGRCLYARSQVTCPWHGAKFNIRTGEVLAPPARQAIARYNVRLTATAIEIQV